jgi:hypothetical protein
MTFQIGMVASDGIILASDTRAGRWDKFKTTSEVRKLVCCPELGVAYCCAGSDVAILAARKATELAEQQPGLSMERCAEKAAIEVWREEYGDPNPRERQYRESVLIAKVTGSDSGLWRLNITSSSYCESILDKDINGDASNSAVFFSEQYFQKMPNTIGSLLPLAAHTVLMAGDRNQTGVGGLEIAICRIGECRKLTEKELAPLRDFSKRLDDSMLKQLANTPNMIG